MAGEKAEEAKKAVEAKMGSANEKLDEHVNKLKNSSLGKKVPVEFDKVDIQKVVWIGMITSILVEANFFGHFFAIATAVEKSAEPSRMQAVGYWVSWIMVAVAAVHDSYACYKRSKILTPVFLALRGVIFVWMLVILVFMGFSHKTYIYSTLLTVGSFVPLAFYAYTGMLFLLGGGQESK